MSIAKASGSSFRFNDGLMVGGGPITIAGFTLLGLSLLAVSITMIVREPVVKKVR